jgi:hypothetical protein
MTYTELSSFIIRNVLCFAKFCPLTSRKLLTYFHIKASRVRRIVTVEQFWNFREVKNFSFEGKYLGFC